MNNDNMSEAEFMEDGAEYLEDSSCKPSCDCMNRACSDYCTKYENWYWDRY